MFVSLQSTRSDLKLNPVQNVVEFETVMANSTVVRVTQETHPDLMVAMQGGGSQYGELKRTSEH